MKKDYIKPEIHLEEIELENQLLDSSTMVDIVPDGTGGWDAKEREEPEDSSWGDLW